MKQNHEVSRPSAPASSPSRTLLASAIAGLVGVVAVTACSGDGGRKDDSTAGTGGSSAGGANDGAGGAPEADAAAGGTSGKDAGAADVADASTGDADAGDFTNVLSTDPITFEAFTKLCADRGGFVTTSANCAGSNLCRGLSYMTDGTILTEHSCRGFNTCAGMSCVDTPKDTGLSGRDLYEFGECGGCHFDRADPKTYLVFVPPGRSASDVLAEFDASSTLRLSSIVAFGTQGINENGTAYSNMPSYRQKYSRAEIERVVEYIKGSDIDHRPHPYTVPGEGDGGAAHHSMDGGE